MHVHPMQMYSLLDSLRAHGVAVGVMFLWLFHAVWLFFALWPVCMSSVLLQSSGATI